MGTIASLKWIVFAAAAVAAGGAGLGHVLGPRIGVALAQPATTGIPYTLETVQQFVSKEGSGPEVRQTLAHRADGQRSMTFYYTRPDGKIYPTRKIMNPRTGELTLVHYDVETKVTEYLPGTHIERYGKMRPDPRTECVTLNNGVGYSAPMTIVGRSKIEGVDVVELAYEDATSRSHEWRAPSLNCDLLKEDRELLDEKKQVTGRVTRWVTSLTLREPAAELFEIPNFPERSPLGATIEYARRFKGGQIQPHVEQVTATREKRYWSLQPTPKDPKERPAAAVIPGLRPQ